MKQNILLLLCISLLMTLLTGAQNPQAYDVIPVYAIQGDTDASPLVDRYVDSFGIVTAVGNDGFYLQDPFGDDNPATSDGLFVYTRTPPGLTVGACVRIRGALVTEFYEKTELSRARSIEPSTLCGEANLTTMEAAEWPGVSLLDAPSERLESLEGMIVALEELDGLVQGPTKRFNSGEAEIAIATPEGLRHVKGGRIFQGTESMNALIYLSNAVGGDLPEVDWGDRVLFEGEGDRERGGDGSLLAVLDYNFGKYQLLLLPGETVTAERGDRVEPPPPSPLGEGEFDLCTFNLFALGTGVAQHPDAVEYAAELRKRALAIAEGLGGCTLIAVQEAGTPQDVQNLAALLAQEHDLAYEAVALAGPMTTNFEFPLTNALLVRMDAPGLEIEVVQAALQQGCSTTDYEVPAVGVCPVGEFALFNRPPLVVDLVVRQVREEDEGGEGDAELTDKTLLDTEPANGEPLDNMPPEDTLLEDTLREDTLPEDTLPTYSLRLIVNHWKSKAGDEERNGVRRTAQAQHVASLAQQLLVDDPSARVVVAGDLNDFPNSVPVQTLLQTEPPLINTVDFIPASERYTYIFNGASQTLDYLVVSPAVVDDLVALEPLPFNTRFAYPLETDIDTIFHASDHDPLRLRIKLPMGAAGEQVFLGGSVRLPGVVVELLDERGELVRESLSDAGGEFWLWGLTPGAYTLRYTVPSQLVFISEPEMTQIEQSLVLTNGYAKAHPPAVAHRSSLAGAAQALLWPELAVAAVEASGE